MRKSLLAILVVFMAASLARGQNYYVYVTAESEDEVALIKFDGKKGEVAKVIPVGVWPAEIEGPHGINVSPDGKYWYLSMAHGNPYGFLYKFSTESNELVGQTTLGLFPASLQISHATGLLYCVNFNLHGDMVPSSVSVVDPENMVELTQITTGVMPHGSRISPDGLKQYSVGMMSGELFELDAVRLKVSRVLNLDENTETGGMGEMEVGMDHSKMGHPTAGTAGGQTAKAKPSTEERKNLAKGEGMEKQAPDVMPAHEKMNHSHTKPTWVIPHPSKRLAYVAGNGSDEVLEVDLDKWVVTRRLKAGKAPYNLDVSPDGTKLVVTYKGAGSTGIWDLETYEELVRVKNSRKVTHGVTISPDSKFAFVSVEGIGGEPGSVDIIDLENKMMVDYVEVGKQAGGIIFWKLEE